jgi:spermidine/putrescine transport system permease protein
MLGKPPWLTFAVFLIYLFFYIPIFLMVLFSFDDSRLAVHWTGFTLKWYDILFHDQALASALINSLVVAGIAVAISAVMGTLAAVGLASSHFRGRDALRALLFLPIIIPEIAMAVSALTLFMACGLTLSLATIIVSHVVFCVAYVALVVAGSLQGMDKHLAEAAMDLGATPTMVFFRVTLPLIMPGVISGSLLAFVLSLDDFVITQFTAGVGDTTLPLRIYSLVKFGVSPEINALSTLMVCTTIGITLVAELIRTRQMKSRSEA